MYRPRLQPSNATHQPISQASSEVAAQAARVQAALKRLNGGWTSTYGSMCALVCNLWQLYGFLWDVHNSDNIFIFWYIVMISNASMWEILTLNCLSSFPPVQRPKLSPLWRCWHLWSSKETRGQGLGQHTGVKECGCEWPWVLLLALFRQVFHEMKVTITPHIPFTSLINSCSSSLSSSSSPPSPPPQQFFVN